ncbi:hypothetical protein BN1708_004055 [Verticillium longisporum]|uniref:Nudix hydrolase domain-containing protein n=1 Tax=Verticillium longisporum TaxID=100787 RepID=A0A0G4LU83_VERLO|nr:hypothetical protein BN1708_004055 [Verticillium longisporum]
MAAYKMQLEDWLDDLCVRFIINLPEEDLSSVARICFQIEEAQWFYEDFVRPLDPTLPSMTLRNFSLRIFQHCPLLAPFSVENHTRAFEEFLQYKTRVPVRGAILLNEDMDSTVLVKGWKKGANWSFPRGKINKDEDDLECAIREVYEETGYDLHAAGLVPPNRDVKHIEITMREQQMRLYVFRDVPMDTHFAPRTRKEISKISWYNLSELPAFRKKGNNQNDAAASAAAANANKFYMVAPFLVPLKKWVVQQKKRDNAKNTQQVHFQPQNLYDEPVTEDDAWVQNKPTAAVVEHTPALDTLEGATKELQRLLKVQPNTQGLQMPSMSDVNRDKGASLLAVLQANSQVQNSGPQIQVPHTPIDYIENASIQTTRLHHQHHPQPRAPLSSYQPPPQFPLEANVPVQYSSHHQQFAQGVPVQGRFQQPHQRLHAASPRATYGNPSPSTEYPTGVDGPTRHEIRPQGYSRPEGLAQFTQNYMPIPKPPPTQLTNHSMALLGVLKSGSKSPNPAPGGNCQQPHIVTNETGQQQGHQPGSNVQSAQYQSSPAFWQQEAPRSAHVSAQNGPGRSTTGTEEHRSALLQMFKKPEGDNAPTTGVARANQGSEAPKTATVGSKHTHGSGHSGVELNPLSSQPIMQQAEQGSAAHQPNLAEPSNLSRMQPNKGATPTPPFTILRRPEVLGQTTAPRQVSVDAAHRAIGQDKPTSLASPPATSSLPTPVALQRKESMSHEQRNKLLSLFSKPPPVAPTTTEAAGRVPDSAAPETTSRSGSAASRGLPLLGQIAQDDVAESRRGSQTPISPADRNFLLSYLASATNNTK